MTVEPRQSLERPDDLSGQVVTKTPNVARGRPAQKEARRFGLGGFVDAAEPPRAVVPEQRVNLPVEKLEVRHAPSFTHGLEKCTRSSE